MIRDEIMNTKPDKVQLHEQKIIKLKLTNLYANSLNIMIILNGKIQDEEF